MKNLGLALINLPRLEDIICQKTSGLPWWPGQGGREVGGGGDPSTDPSSARLHLVSRAARSGVLTTGTPRDLLWADCWPVVLGTGLELVHQRAQDISPALTRLSRRQSQDAPGPEPHCSRTAPPHAHQPRSVLLPGTAAPLQLHLQEARGPTTDPHWPQLGLLLPGLAQHLSLPRDPARARARPRHRPHVATPIQLLCKLTFYFGMFLDLQKNSEDVAESS